MKNPSNNLFVRLFHGRHTKDEGLNEWGFDGPVIGPVWIGCTYGNIRLGRPDQTDDANLVFDDDLVAYDGKYYGDFEILAQDDMILAENFASGKWQFHTFDAFKVKSKSVKTTEPEPLEIPIVITVDKPS